MKPALLLLDLQKDYLARPGLEPAAGELVGRAAELLRGCREQSVPVLHVQTTVSSSGDDRKPHWRRAGRWECIAGTEGHQPPPALLPEDEPVIEKTWFSGFSNPELDVRLSQLGARELIICGLFLYGCVRATVLDAYERGYEVWLADDAVGSDDGLHAGITRGYLGARAARFATAGSLLAMLRDGSETAQWPAPGEDGKGSATRGALAAAASAGRSWRREPVESRARVLERAADALEGQAAELASLIVSEIGKPVRYSAAEVQRAVALLRTAASLPEARPNRVPEAEVRRVPLGTVAQITPFNNPLAVPVGKLAAALRYGNSVVWKPSQAAPGVAERTLGLLEQAGLPAGVVSLQQGGAEAAAALMAAPGVDAVSLTGSSQAGFTAQAICARRRIPLQAELGGNNGAIVWRDCDVGAAAAAVAEAGFGAAGQRCTANRRVIVDEACYGEFVERLESASAALEIGDPADPRVHVGHLVSGAARDRVAGAVERARSSGEVREPIRDLPRLRRLLGSGPYLAPAIVLCDDPGTEIVQEETFGPVVVVQRAPSFERAVELLNGVRQGLVASLFSPAAELRELFLREAEAGVLKLNRATADVGVEAPFGGWKASGVGPPEHGDANRDFYTRTQTVYA